VWNGSEAQKDFDKYVTERPRQSAKETPERKEAGSGTNEVAERAKSGLAVSSARLEFY
jgi:hypothetical protein